MYYEGMKEEFMERYEAGFEICYNSIYQFAVAHKGEKDYERRLISRVREQNYFMKGQLAMIAPAFLSFPEQQKQEERINTVFDAYRQFGIILGTDGAVYKANLDNSLRIRDQEAWNKAEEVAVVEKHAKAEIKTHKVFASVR